MISSAELRCREAAVSFARDSVNLEGLEPSKAEEEHAVRFIEGEIELAKFTQPKTDACYCGKLVRILAGCHILAGSSPTRCLK